MPHRPTQSPRKFQGLCSKGGLQYILQINCDNDHCKKNPNVALLIWNKLDQDQQNLISCSLSPEDQEVLFAAVGLTKENS